MKIATALAIVSFTAACDPEGATTMPSAAQPSNPPPLDATEIRSGTVSRIGATCRVGAVAVRSDGVLLSVAWDDPAAEVTTESRQDVKWGGLLAACGGLYRAVTHRPGGYAVFEAKPVAPPAGTSLRSDGLVVTLGGEGVIIPRVLNGPDLVAKVVDITGASAGGTTAATLELDVYVSGESPGRKTQRETRTVKAGDALTTSRGKYSVLSIVPPAPDQGIVGWVELAARPHP